MKKFLLSDIPFIIVTILFAAFTIYEIYTRDEFSLTSIIISFWYFGYLLAYLLSTPSPYKREETKKVIGKAE